MLLGHYWVVLSSAALTERLSDNGASAQTIRVESNHIKKLLKRAGTLGHYLFVDVHGMIITEHIKIENKKLAHIR